ncbi:hypothetical protein D9619_003944 [Psilocybe cf. subviscida]|uniref:Uncharacterized protein n=1 Tax=Psilocybe cf. subviscida TaxID=2480587 RepID=A0A8H5F849_9AGAR|nr:hypothetical protein D9619_003944 [Psilocybe cf. subviscida]
MMCIIIMDAFSTIMSLFVSVNDFPSGESVTQREANAAAVQDNAPVNTETAGKSGNSYCLIA